MSWAEQLKKVQTRRDKVCLCLNCAEDATIMETGQIHVLDERILMERLKEISKAFIAKYDGDETNRAHTKK